MTCSVLDCNADGLNKENTMNDVERQARRKGVTTHGYHFKVINCTLHPFLSSRSLVVLQTSVAIWLLCIANMYVLMLSFATLCHHPSDPHI